MNPSSPSSSQPPLNTNLMLAANNILGASWHQSGVLQNHMRALHIQPRPGLMDNADVLVLSTDQENESCPECKLNSMMVSAVQSGAQELHNLNCQVDPVPTLHSLNECFGIAFFSKIQQNLGAAVRLRNTLAEVATRLGRAFVAATPQPGQGQLEFIHQLIPPFATPLRPGNFLPMQLFRIRYSGITAEHMDHLITQVLSSLPATPKSKTQSHDVFNMTLSSTC